MVKPKVKGGSSSLTASQAEQLREIKTSFFELTAQLKQMAERIRDFERSVSTNNTTNANTNKANKNNKTVGVNNNT